jgi:hypothetical protein
MERPENNKWLDEALTETIGSEKPRTDFEQWKQQHPEAVNMLTSRAHQHTSVTVRSFSLRNTIMKSPLTKFAVAAVVIITCLIGLSLWRTTGSGIALADVLAQIEKVKAFRFKWISTAAAEVAGEKTAHEIRATSLNSQDHGKKSIWEVLDPNGGESSFEEHYSLPDNRTKIGIWPKQKKYMRVEFDDGWLQRNLETERHSGGVTYDDPRELTKQILEYKGRSIGRATVDGIVVEGFQTTDPNWIGNRRNKRQVDVKMWVDVKTRLPVRYEFTYAYFDKMGDKIVEQERFVMHDFQWDVVADAAEFEPVIPDDYTGTVVKFPPHITEETAIQGLKLWVELLGNYPESIWDAPMDLKGMRTAFEKGETPDAVRLKEQIRGLTDEEMGNKLVDFLMPIRGLGRFYGVLQWARRDPAYYGQTVTPKDVDKVLMRWKVSDNEYRVIYGDLHAETVTPEKLAELEAALPK